MYAFANYSVTVALIQGGTE